MKKKTASELFGAILPYPIISSITLESGGSLIENIGKNPHISVVPEPVQVPIDSDPTAGTNLSGLKTKVIVSVRDVIESDGSTSFFDKNILDCMSFVVIQCTDASKTAQYIQNPENLYIIVDAFFQGYGDTIDDIEFKSQIMSTDTDISPNAIINGENVYEKPYSFEFHSSNTQPAHLSYFAVCVLDRFSLMSKYELDIETINDSLSTFDISEYMESNYHIVIDGGSIVNAEYVYLLPNGEQWTGPVHNHQGKWMAGKTHTNKPHPTLTKKMVSSSGITKDFRDFTDFPLNKEQFYQDQNTLADLIATPYGKKFSQDIVDNKKRSLSYDIINYSMPFKDSSDISTSKIGILLGLDARELQIRHGLIKKGQGDGPLVVIKNLTFYRKNIDTQEIKQIHSGPPAVFSTDLHGGQQKYQFFHVPDLAPAGNYEYYVELELDRTNEINFIKQMSKLLRNFIMDLDTYYMLATKSTIESINMQSKDSGSPIADSANYGDLSGQKISTPFNHFTGKFTNAFINNPDIQLIYNNLLPLTPTIKSTAALLFPEEEVAKKVATFEKAINPATGTPDGILMVKKIVTNLLQDIEKIFGGKIKNISQGFYSGWGEDILQKTAIKERHNEKIIINLKSKLEIKDNIDYGYDYLPNYNLQGIPRFTGQEFVDHITTEIKKYFNDKGISAPVFNTYFGNISNNLSLADMKAENLALSARRTKAGNVMITNVPGLQVTNPEKVKNLQEKVLLSIVDRNISGIEANNKNLNYFPQSTGQDISDLNQVKQLDEILSAKGISVLNENPYTSEELIELSEQDDNTSTSTSSEENPDKNDSLNYNGKLFVNNFSQSILFNMIRCLDITFKKLKSLDYYRLDMLDPQSGNFGTATLKNENKDKENIIFAIREKIISELPPSSQDEVQLIQVRTLQILNHLPLQILSLILGANTGFTNTPGIVDEQAFLNYVNNITNPFSETNNSGFNKSENRRKDFESGYADHWFNYDNLVKVEYLDTFSEGLANPQWEPLVLYSDETLPSGTNILCRLVKYDDNLLNVKRPEVLELPIYNKYFLIEV